MLNTLRTAMYTQPLLCALPGVMIFILDLLQPHDRRPALGDGHQGMSDRKPLAGGPRARQALPGQAHPARARRHLRLGGRRCRLPDVSEGETAGRGRRSGCGKSTTARLLMHLIEPTAGHIRFEGRTVGTAELPLKEFRRQVQMVFQDSYASLSPRLTVEESIAFGPTVLRRGARRGGDRARELLNRVGLDPARFAGRFTHELSGGQRQRVNIARPALDRASWCWTRRCPRWTSRWRRGC